MVFSAKLLRAPDAKSREALKRIALAKARVQKVLDRERVAHQKTLEHKISDQGPIAGEANGTNGGALRRTNYVFRLLVFVR